VRKSSERTYVGAPAGERGWRIVCVCHRPNGAITGVSFHRSYVLDVTTSSYVLLLARHAAARNECVDLKKGASTACGVVNVRARASDASARRTVQRRRSRRGKGCN
jgi:hypothetical protein